MKVADIPPDVTRRARLYRDGKLRRLQEVYGACACAFPLTSYRNGHGHAEDCPAIEVLVQQEQEIADARAEQGEKAR
jgi:hypothetical protein